ncbi:hypothetical protein ACFY05_31825 [Microtetraspora fusca]|uniref:Uncharacterized protein n=1 Tax=Microtetraspora fusca TaxID=1997 RepID=A0ABW6VDP0_MICFU
MNDLDSRPIEGHLYVYRIEPHPDGTTRTAVWRPRKNPGGRILYYEGVRYIDNGETGANWRGEPPFYEGGQLVAETTFDPTLTHLRDQDRVRSTIARTWGPVTCEHHVTNWDNLDVPIFRPEDWE